MGNNYAQLNPSNPVLSEYAGRARPMGAVAQYLFPDILKMGQRSGKIRIFGESNMELPVNVNRGHLQEANEAEASDISYIDYSTTTYARKAYLGNSEVEEYVAGGGSAADLEMQRTADAVDPLYIKMEYDAATVATTSGSYNSSHYTAIASSSEWDSSGGGDPIGVIENLKDVLFGKNIIPLGIIVPRLVWNVLQTHDNLLGISKYTKNGRLDEQSFQDILGLIPIIADMNYVSAGSWTQIWGDNCVIFGTDPAVGLTPTRVALDKFVQDAMRRENMRVFGRTIRSQDWSVKMYDAPEKDHNGARAIEAQTQLIHKPVTLDSSSKIIGGCLISNCLA